MGNRGIVTRGVVSNTPGDFQTFSMFSSTLDYFPNLGPFVILGIFHIKHFRRRTLSVFTCFRLRGLICERRRRRRRRDENLESQEGGEEDEEGRFKIRNIERVEEEEGEEGEGGGRGGGEVAKYL